MRKLKLKPGPKPKAKAKLKHTHSIRFTMEEWRLIGRASGKSTRSEFVRRAALEMGRLALNGKNGAK